MHSIGKGYFTASFRCECLGSTRIMSRWPHILQREKMSAPVQGPLSAICPKALTIVS